MLRRIWQRIVQLFRRLFGSDKSSRTNRTARRKPVHSSFTPEQKKPEAPKPLENSDYEFLFMQLLEGVGHGWQQSRVLKFVAELEGRTTEEKWVAWLRGFGDRLLASPAPNQDLAIRMLQLGAVGCGQLGELAGEIASRLLEKGNKPYLLQPVQTNLELSEVTPIDSNYEMGIEPQQISLDELWQMLQEDTGLAEQMADLFQLESNDPQSIIQAITADRTTNDPETTGSENQLQANQPLDIIEAEFIQDGDPIDPTPTTTTVNEVEILFNQGLAQYNSRNFEGAIECWNRLLEIDPNLYEVWDNKGLALLDLHRYEEAVASYDRAIELKADDAQIWNNRGTALANLGNYEEAVVSYDRAIEFKADNAEIWHNRGTALTNLGRYEEAIASYDRAIEIKADDSETWNSRGNTWKELGMYEEAIVNYDRALEIKPDKYQAWYNRGIALFHLGRFEEEIASLDCAIAIQPKFYQAWIERGKAAANSLAYDHLLASLSTICKQNLALNQRGYEGQIASYQEGLKQISKDAQPEGWGRLHLAIGQAHYRQGQRNSRPKDYWRKAVSEYKEAIGVLTETAFPEAHLEVIQELFKALLSLGELAEVERLEQKALDILNSLLKQPKISKHERQQIGLKFIPLQQLRVDLAVKSGAFIKALELAESHKNACLSWILDLDGNGDRNPLSPKWVEIRRLLAPKKAIVYWHLSPSELTTFILKHDTLEPIVLREPPTPEETKFPLRTIELEKWIADWDRQYQEYLCSQDKENHYWRQEMSAVLTHLANILDISEIVNELVGIDELILIPHRELYRFPLHYLFPEELTTCYLPSIKLGLNNQNKDKINRLLSVESSNSEGLSPLEYTELEVTAISQIFDNSTRLADEETTKVNVINALLGEYDIFHFTGHSDYNYAATQRSSLCLSGKDKLTLKDICQLDLTKYYLIYLSTGDTTVYNRQAVTTEYVSLASASIAKGASYAVSTLWTIADNSSAFLTIEFYRRLKADIPPTQALKQARDWLRTVTFAELSQWCKNLSAQLAHSDPAISQYLRILGISLQGNTDKIDSPAPPYAHPYHWAAFTITGATRSA